jgi:hypothetical protein
MIGKGELQYQYESNVETLMVLLWEKKRLLPDHLLIAATSWGRASPTGECEEKLAHGVSGVSWGLISMTVAPILRAKKGSEAAGSTRVDVPTDRKTWQDFTAWMAASRASGGRLSPNHTTSGRRKLPQRGQRGGISFDSGHSEIS